MWDFFVLPGCLGKVISAAGAWGLLTKRGGSFEIRGDLGMSETLEAGNVCVV